MTPLRERVDRLAEVLHAQRVRVLGLLADNGEDWALADLAALAAGIPIVPLPLFFSASQLAHAVAATGMDALYCPSEAQARRLGFRPAGFAVPLHRRDAAGVALPAGTAKISFTSGTTGAPKGACLSAPGQSAVAHALATATRGLGIERHLCLLPLALLLENIAGIHAALAAGVEWLAPPLAETGMSGAAGFDARACLAAIERHRAGSVILLPQMLLAIVAQRQPAPRSLRFVAVGGARVAPALLAQARGLGFPVHEGYGLTECASVVSLNAPGADRPGSVGRVLPHAQARIGADGEILVKRAAFLGYVGERACADEWLPTGDLGRLDSDGFLHVEGRRRNVLITSFGRNVAPEWPEAELLAGGALAQAAVFGEGRPRLCAVLFAPAEVSDKAIDAQVWAANARLPDYARIGAWVRAESAFAPQNGLATANGRVRRDAVWQRYRERFDAL
ncbi:MAG TPA: AMP-binding protein [Burkholderiales bacterium]|nr:AMP-binding protein [Burkholderiales bacterium]